MKNKLTAILVLIFGLSSLIGLSRLMTQPLSAAVNETIPPAWKTGAAETAAWGEAIAGAGDVNNDGYDDLIVGAPTYGDGGAVFLFYGRSAGLPLLPDMMLAADTANAYFGGAVAGAGDVNNDGYDDVLVGAPGRDNNAGAVYLYLGGPAGISDTPDWQRQGDTTDSYLGHAVAGAGDVNGDEFADILFSAPGYGVSDTFRPGWVYLFYGSSDGPTADPWIATGSTNGDMFGSALAGPGDVDDNGYDDILIGAEKFDSTGTDVGYAGLFFGDVDGLPPFSHPEETSWFVTGLSGDDLGHSVSGAGDLNGDDIPDFMIGSPLYDNSLGEQIDVGKVDFYLGSINLQSTISITLQGLNDFDAFGDDIAGIGDFDGDGFDDVIIGATFADDAENCDVAVTRPGIAYIFRGDSEVTIGASAAHTFSNCQTNSEFGFAVAGAGDVNGDDYADAAVGAPGANNASGGEGEAYAYYGAGEITGLEAGNDSPQGVDQAVDFSALIETGGYVLFSWDFGDGAVGSGSAPSHAYALPGVYEAVVKAETPYNTTVITAATTVIITSNSLIDPETGGELTYTADGRGVNIVVPPGAVTETVTLGYTPLMTITQPSPAGSIGYYFDLDVAAPQRIFMPSVIDASMGTAVRTPNTLTTPFNAPPAFSTTGDCPAGHTCFAEPLTITVFYTDASVIGKNENELELLFWDATGYYDAVNGDPGWPNANRTCDYDAAPTVSYTYFPDENKFTLQVCHLSRFGVVGVN